MSRKNFSVPDDIPREDLDAFTLEILESEGIVMDEPVPVEFFLYVENEILAKAITSRIDSRFEVRFAPSFADASWCVVASATMIPSAANLQRCRVRFESLAAEVNGTYDGWAVAYSLDDYDFAEFDSEEDSWD